MELNEYIQYDGLGLAALVRDKQITPHELLQTALKAVEAVNPKINAVIDVYRDMLEKTASEEIPAGSFGGVPFLLKDLAVAEAGRPYEFGSRIAKGYVADFDSFLTMRYKKAGLQIFGRSAAAEMGYSMSTETDLHGATRNPWNTDLIPSGSSGGAAAAVAAGILPMAHGNDAGGSIRIPAACCGVFGLKPSRGRISNGPAIGDTVMGFAIEHAITRSVRDSAALLDVGQGYEPGDPYIINKPERPYLEEASTPPGKLRIAFTSIPWSGVPVDKENILALEKTARLCRDLGHEMIEAAPQPAIDWPSFNMATMKCYVASFAGLVEFLAMITGRAPSEENLPYAILATLEEAAKLKVGDLGQSMAIINMAARSIAPFFEQYDVLLTPGLASRIKPVGYFDMHEKLSPPEWGDRLWRFAPFSMIWNVLGQPAMMMPLQQSTDNLPIAMQFVAKFGEEARLFRLAGQLEEAAPWADRRPPVHVLNV